jgi:hypothetical protein
MTNCLWRDAARLTDETLLGEQLIQHRRLHPPDVPLNEGADVPRTVSYEVAGLDESTPLPQLPISSYSGNAAVPYLGVLIFVEKSFDWFPCYAFAFAQL